jgi:hypothetical protein
MPHTVGVLPSCTSFPNHSVYNRHGLTECPSAGGVTTPYEERWWQGACLTGADDGYDRTREERSGAFLSDL